MYSSPDINSTQIITSQQQQFQPLQFKPFKPPDGEFDGKRLRKNVMRKTVDYNSSIVRSLEARIWQRDEQDRPELQPDICFASELHPPQAYPCNPINAVVTKFVRTSTNKAKAHESSVRTMVWSHNDQWMITGDTGGVVKYWQTNMNNVKMFQAHKDPVRGLSFSSTDQKFASGSDDGTVKVWDFFRCSEERTLRGHGADVKCVAWHPFKSLLASGSKDTQQPIKLWDPRTGRGLSKLHAHKSTVMDLKWNPNGNWLCSASRDHLLKLFDVRNLSTELQVFRGHKKEASSIAWHPQHEGLFASGGSDGSILFWHVGNDKEVGNIDTAHDGIVWGLAWHPLGHILCSGSNDHTSKFWTRNRAGDKMRDKYNLNTLPEGVLVDDSMDIDDIPMTTSTIPTGSIPGMGPDDRIEEKDASGVEIIPGLDFDTTGFDRFMKKIPYAKPIPKTFQAAWNSTGTLEELEEQPNPLTSWVVVESASLFFPEDEENEGFFDDDGELYPAGAVPLDEIEADAIAYYGFYIPLNKVPAKQIATAFRTKDEEKALTEITNDPDFVRKLIREKNQLVNPSIYKQEDVFGLHGNALPNQKETVPEVSRWTAPKVRGTGQPNFRGHHHNQQQQQQQQQQYYQNHQQMQMPMQYPPQMWMPKGSPFKGPPRGGQHNYGDSDNKGFNNQENSHRKWDENKDFGWGQNNGYQEGGGGEDMGNDSYDGGSGYRYDNSGFKKRFRGPRRGRGRTWNRRGMRKQGNYS